MGDRWRKLSTLVDFPINNLDLSNYVHDYSFLASQDIACTYDLCGIVNHYGSLTYGHYVSVVKNPFDGHWYRYDDQHRIRITESQIPKESAYILFYVRKDTQHKKLNDVFPDPELLFPGKPVRTKHGDGYILGAKTPDLMSGRSEEYYVMINQNTYEVARDQIYPDLDSKENSAMAFSKIEEISKSQQKEFQGVEQKTDQQGHTGFFKTFFKGKGTNQVDPCTADTSIEPLTIDEERKKYNNSTNFQSNVSTAPLVGANASSQYISPRQVRTNQVQQLSTPDQPRAGIMNSDVSGLHQHSESEKVPLIGATNNDEMEGTPQSVGIKAKKKKKKKKKKKTSIDAEQEQIDGELNQI